MSTDLLVFVVQRPAGVGVFSMPWQRRGDFARMWRELGVERVSWKRVKRGTLELYRTVVDEFFARPWLRFDCVLGKDVNPGALLASAGRIRATQAVQAHETRLVPRKTPGLQLARLFLRLAIMAGREKDVTGARQELAHHVAERLGVQDLARGAWSAARRFRITQLS